jgi:hypothetical protein
VRREQRQAGASKKITKAGLLSNERLRQPHALIVFLENAGNSTLSCRRLPVGQLTKDPPPVLPDEPSSTS